MSLSVHVYIYLVVVFVFAMVGSKTDDQTYSLHLGHGNCY